MRVLVVEDSDINLLLIRSYLKELGVEIDAAANGAIGVEKFQSGDYDLVLMDLQMPIMDGYQATRNIRTWERAWHRRPTPILAFTASALEEEREESLAAGCDAHLAKPIHKAAMLEAVRKYLQPPASSPRPDAIPGDKIAVKPPREIEEAIPLFLESMQDDLETLSQALEEGDYSQVRHIGHDLKGTGSAYGFDQISVIGKSIEEAAKGADSREISRHIAELTDYLDRVEVIFE